MRAFTGTVFLLAVCQCLSVSAFANDGSNPDQQDDTDIASVTKMFESSQSTATADFQRHVVPLLGRLGCNGRACHGSFQGQGGFQLSLFGYDFEADHAALHESRVDTDDPAESLVLYKPTNADDHDGGLRFENDSWQYRLLENWIANGAERSEQQKLRKLIVTPPAILFDPDQQNESTQLRVTAIWQDGLKEDVTELCRFRTNDPQIAKIDENGLVSSGQSGDTHVVVFYDQAVHPIEIVKPLAAADVGFDYSNAPTQIDKLINSKLNKVGIIPSPKADDATFLRRVSLDIAGTLPSPDEIHSFVNDPSPDKRYRKITELLESPAYAAWWTTFLCDLTGNNTQQLRQATLQQNQASNLWYRWIYERVENNTPYDEIARGIVLGTSRNEDESYADYCERMSEDAQNSNEGFVSRDSMPYYWMRQDVQTPEDKAINFAHAFLGIRIQCAQCHKHPFDQWTKDDFQQFSRFFSGTTYARAAMSQEDRQDLEKILDNLEVDEAQSRNINRIRRELIQFLSQGKTIPFPQMVVHEPRAARARGQRRNRQQLRIEDARLLGTDKIDLTQFQDVRQPVMDWMLESENPYFARAMVNRVWARYFGAGIIEPVDDLNLANPPSNEGLLEYLTWAFIHSGYDLKWLHQEITLSDAYQRSWVTNETNINDQRNSAVRFLDVYLLGLAYDVILQSTVNAERNASFAENMQGRAIAIPGTVYNFRTNNRQRITPQYALQIFGRSSRSSACDCDRSNETSLIQTVYLQNDRDIHTLIQQPNGWIAEVAKEIAPPTLDETQRRQLNQWEGRVKQAERQLARLEGKDDEKSVKSRETIQKGLEKLRERIEPLRELRAAADMPVEEIKTDELIAQAYLRTLSRKPTAEELDACREYFENSASPVKGLEGILWTLINTKEFIINH